MNIIHIRLFLFVIIVFPQLVGNVHGKVSKHLELNLVNVAINSPNRIKQMFTAVPNYMAL